MAATDVVTAAAVQAMSMADKGREEGVLVATVTVPVNQTDGEVRFLFWGGAGPGRGPPFCSAGNVMVCCDRFMVGAVVGRHRFKGMCREQACSRVASRAFGYAPRFFRSPCNSGVYCCSTICS